MELSLFDLHCDTAYEMLRQKQPLSSNHLAISLENARKFKRYIQVMALWTDLKLDDGSGWQSCLAMLENLRNDATITSGDAMIQTSVSEDLRPTLLLAVEDARILDGKLERVDRLYQSGIRILTPLWKGLTCIGGSHDTDQGLTPFGKKALKYALDLGMILDISHASECSAEDIFALAKEKKRPVIASHSNAYSVCPVSRNLRDGQIQSILSSDGIIGINLYRGFLTQDGNACAEDILPHIEYFLEQGAKNALCIGGDMDGAELPDDIPNLSALPLLAELMLKHNYPEKLIYDIFYQNAFRFAQKYLF